MKCAGCQQEIVGMAFETPQGKFCLDCRILSLRGKENQPWPPVLFVLGLIVILLLASAGLPGGG